MILGRREGQAGPDSLGEWGGGGSVAVTGGPCTSYPLGHAAVSHHTELPAGRICAPSPSRDLLYPKGSSPLIRATYFQLLFSPHTPSTSPAQQHPLLVRLAPSSVSPSSATLLASSK